MGLFFQKSQSDEDCLYAKIRDYPKYLDVKNQIEKFWNIYGDYADDNFLIQIQKSNQFKQRWWELILGTGLIESGTNICKKNNPIGPDIKINTDPAIFIEAIAPSKGDDKSTDRLHELEFGRPGDVSIRDLPKEQFQLRLTTAFDQKYKKYKEYLDKKIIEPINPYIIAISSCNLSEYGELMDFPINVIFSILAGAGNLVLSKRGNFIEYQKEISKHNLASIKTNLFLNPKYCGISGVIYSSSNILNCPKFPEDKFILVKNPNAVNIIPDNIFNIETWVLDTLNMSLVKIKSA